jgi:hypothetical protein
VVRDYKHLSVREPAQPFAFVPLWQPVNPISRLTLSVLSGAPGPALAGAVASEIRRLALGASRSKIAVGVIAEAMLPVAAGIAIGLPLALGIARAGQRLLFGVTPADATSYLVGAGALAVAAAAWLPAQRACGLDPAETLRRG